MTSQKRSICLTFIGFRICTRIHINIDSLRVHRSVRPNHYPYAFYSQNCLHIKQGLQKYCETAYSRSGINQMWILKNSLRVHRSVRPNHYPYAFYSQNCLHIKQGLQKYCETAYSKGGINQMWILKNSKELLDHLKYPNFNLITNIKSFDFSTLYTTIPHQKLKSRLASIIRNSFLHKKKWKSEKQIFGFRSRGSLFCKGTLIRRASTLYTEEDTIKMLEFLVDNIFVVFVGKVFQQIIGIPMGTNCALFLADIFLYSYEAEFIQSLLSAGRKRLASQFNFTYRHIDDVLPINNPDFENYLGQMYPPLSLRSMTQRRATLLLPTWIYPCQSVGTVNIALPFTTSVTISISILQTFRS